MVSQSDIFIIMILIFRKLKIVIHSCYNYKYIGHDMKKIHIEAISGSS